LQSVASEKLVKAISLLIILLGATAVSLALQSPVIVPSSGLIYYPLEAQILFEDEFESGNFSAWNGTNTSVGNKAVVTTLNPYQGPYHAAFETNSVPSGANFAYSYVDLPAATSEVYARAYFYIIDGLPLDDSDDRFGLILFEVNEQIVGTFRVHHSSGVDRFNVIGSNGTSGVAKSTDAIYPVEGEWYCLEFYVRVHESIGEYRVWINGIEQITIANINNARYGSGVTRVRFGLPYTANVQHSVKICVDSVVISTRPVGLVYAFGVIGDDAQVLPIRNFYWLFGNQSISYRVLRPSDVNEFADVALFKGLVVWTKNGGYNSVAVRKFAQTRLVISHVTDFCKILYPSLSSSIQVVSTNTVTYAKDWGNFQSGDLVEMRNETGNLDKLATVLASGLSSFTNITVIAGYDANRIALFSMSGQQSKSGFCVMDLDATTPETEWTGIWHLFPAIKMVHDFPTGKYAQWMANGRTWQNLDWVYDRIDTIVNQNSDVAKKHIIGYSVQGRQIPLIKIGTGNRYAIVDGSIHGNEKVGTFACLRIAELLIQYYRSDPYWTSRLKEFTVLIIPVLNPDGFYHNIRENANGQNLNRQFPPGGATTEPEAWALRWLMGNCTPTVYITIHESGPEYPLDMMLGNYEVGANKTLTRIAMQEANKTFTELKHWGWYTEGGENVWIGKVDAIYSAGITSMTVAYASLTYGSSCMLLETLIWSPSCAARKCLWGIDYYTAVIISFLQNIQR
jgi:hypothetical protein